MIGKFVKGSTRAIRLLNQRPFTITLFIVGFISAAVLVPSLTGEGVTKREAFGTLLLIFLPYLILKGVILIMLLLLDISINFSAKKVAVYRLNYEKAKIRMAKFFIDRNIEYTKLDNFEFGIEKYLVSVMQNTLAGSKFNYPANFVSKKPFVVARLYDRKDGTIQAKVLYEEEREAEILGRMIIASLEALVKENPVQEPAVDFMGVRGGILLELKKGQIDSPPLPVESIQPESAKAKKKKK